MKNGFKAVQIGGPSGGCLTEEHLDLPLAYDSLRSVGAMVGSGGLVVMNQRTCMVSIARFFMEFTQRESCGKCVLCREGTKQLLALLDDVIEGRADAGTLDLLEKLGQRGAGRVAVRTGKDGAEPGAVDAALLPQGVRGARLRKALPHRPLQGAAEAGDQCRTSAKAAACASNRARPAPLPAKRRSRTHIDPELCIKCGACAKACKLHAVEGI